MLIGVIATAAVLALPGCVVQRRWSREREACRTLVAVSLANEAFRRNDADGNGVPDYWTVDVYGLHGLLPLSGTGEPRPSSPIRLIAEDIALADARSAATALYPHVAPSREGGWRNGYAFLAFRATRAQDGSLVPLAHDTDGPGGYGSVHHRSEYEYMSFPETLAAGQDIYFVLSSTGQWHKQLFEDSGYHATLSPLDAKRDSTYQIRGDLRGTGYSDLGEAIRPFSMAELYATHGPE